MCNYIVLDKDSSKKKVTFLSDFSETTKGIILMYDIIKEAYVGYVLYQDGYFVTGNTANLDSAEDQELEDLIEDNIEFRLFPFA